VALLDEEIALAVAAMRAGEAVVYPTETFYGIGTDAFSMAGLERIFAVKGRDAAKTIALIAHDEGAAFAVAREVPDIARRLARAFWPGPLTIVMPARHGIPDPLIGPGGGVGVRVSPHPVARELARCLGPITATSANLSGQPPATSLTEARIAFGSKVKVYLEGGTLGAALASTVVTFDRGVIKVLRAGAIAEHRLSAALAGVRT